MIRQIAGALARRIITYAKVGENTRAADELGFIKFGSRVEIVVPNTFDVSVKKGDKVRGCRTVLGKFKN